MRFLSFGGGAWLWPACGSDFDTRSASREREELKDFRDRCGGSDAWEDGVFRTCGRVGGGLEGSEGTFHYIGKLFLLGNAL